MEKRREILLSALQDKDDEIKKAAAEAIENLAARGRLLDLTQKIASAPMIEKVRAIYVIGALKGPSVAEALIKAAKDPSEDVRAAAIRVLGGVPDANVLPHIVEALKDASAVVQRVALEAMANFRDARILPAVMQVLKNQDSGVVERAVELAGRIGDKRTEEAMLYFAVKGNHKMRLAAIKALGEMDV
ncbi:MAG: HEAT repeat domain-containing protein [Deltaproteobacteria bacterium]|nr:HEAT repeat domain-containing protein [Deltaproteobacteria bacterium]